ncbi:MAG: hypothetical protein B6D34_07560 [Candidatus Brocadia sp. UTAMX1]|nr:MAG: hypothetical protein B6D34_07560 [Candidatus Brocadia sp. UTAMX1]
MKNILAYFEEVQNLIQRLVRVEIERYEEQVLSKDRGNLRIRLRFYDNSLLELREAIHDKEGMFAWLSYRYHYQRPDGRVIFRYDNTPHHPKFKTHSDHKYTEESVVEFVRPSIEEVLLH